MSVLYLLWPRFFVDHTLKIYVSRNSCLEQISAEYKTRDKKSISEINLNPTFKKLM